MRKSGFRQQLLKIFLSVALPVFAAVAVISYFALLNGSIETTRSTQENETEMAFKNLEQIMEDTESLSEDIIINSEVQSILMQNFQGDPYPDDNQALYYINEFIANRDYVNSLVLTGLDSTLLSTERAFTNITDFSTIESSDWYREFVQSKEVYKWYITQNIGTDSIYKVDAEGEATEGLYGSAYESNSAFSWQPLMMVRDVYSDSRVGELMGYLMIYLDQDYILDILSDVQYADVSNLWLVDNQGEILLRNETDRDYSTLLGKAQEKDSGSLIFFNGKLYIFSKMQMKDVDLTLYMVTPYTAIDNSIRVFSWQTLILIFSVSIILIILIYKASEIIAKPVVELSEIMDSFHGETRSFTDSQPLRIPEDRRYEERTDEIGEMYRSYKQMVNRMDTMINEIYIKNLEKQDAELALLQSQINPHFLYNTLDSINWMAMANDQDEISEMVTALSDTFRLSLTKSKSSYTLLSQELEYVKSYLVLQKFRYNERLEYHISAEEDLLALYIPKFILQPIIENALKHGIDSMEDGGRIDLTFSMNGNYLFIAVENDGDNIDLEQMKKILDFDPNHMEYLAFNKKGYGVQNIHRRICILCGPEYGLEYYVSQGRTRCLVTLPVRRTE